MPTFCYSKSIYERKPSNAAPLQNKKNYVQEEKTIEEIASLCGSGHAWRAGIYDMSGGTFRKKDVLSNQLVALDFDSCRTEPLEVAQYAENIGLPANFWYFSYSQEPQKAAEIARKIPTTYKLLLSHRGKTDDFSPKNGFNFRLVWCLEREISPREYESTIVALLAAFDRYSPDKATKDCSRLWYGGALGSCLLTTEPLRLSALGAFAAKQKVREGIEPRKAMKQKKGFIPEYAGLPEQESVTVSSRWYEKLQGRCYLLDKFREGKYLDYNERLSLFSNLRYLSYNTKARTVLEDVLSWFNPQTYAGHTCDEEQIRAKFRDCTLKPVPIVRGRGGKLVTVPEFFEDDIDIPITPQCSKVTMQELDAWMDEAVPAFLNDRTGSIRILKSQTGSGKTKRVIDWLLSLKDLQDRKIIYSSPKHDNLKEFEERFLAKANFNQTGLIHRCPPREVSQEDVFYLQLGLPAKTKSAERKGFIDKLFNEEDKGVFLITHSLLTALSGLDPDMIVIDEEIDSSLVKETKIELSNLASIVPFLESATVKKLVDFIDEVKSRDRANGIEIDLSFLRQEVAPQLREQVDAYLATTNAANIAAGFFYCMENDGKLSEGKAGTNCIRIARKSTLIEECSNRLIPVRIFTATPMNKRTEKYYGVQIEVLEAPLAANTGRIIQYRGCSGAKGRDNDRLPALAEYMKSVLPADVIENSPLLTFKCGGEQDRDFWKGQGFNLANDGSKQIHLANNSGLDLFKGRTIIVAGKYDLPHQSYQDMWDDIGDGKELGRQNQNVQINGVEQTLYLYTEPVMRGIQIQNIQQAAEQAAGRARTLREEGATVYLFCNFVIADADEVHG